MYILGFPFRLNITVTLFALELSKRVLIISVRYVCVLWLVDSSLVASQVNTIKCSWCTNWVGGRTLIWERQFPYENARIV